MSWPDPGTPPQHDPRRDAPDGAPDHARDGAPDREHDREGDGTEGAHADAAGTHAEGSDRSHVDRDAPSTDLGGGLAPGTDAAPTYARLRSESGDDLGRWESPVVPPDREDPDPTDGDVADDPGSDVDGEPGREDDGANGAPEGRTGGTPQDALSGVGIGAETSGVGGPPSSPYGGSSESALAPPSGPGAGAERSPIEDDASGELAPPGDGTPETTPPAAPGGPGAPAEQPHPEGASAFHGERAAAAPTVPAGDPFHGEHASGGPAREDASPGGPAPEVPVAAPRSASAAVIEDALSGLDEGIHHATVICVANQKGGVGKTTTTVSLGAALAMLGAQVLVVDLDPQGNATTGLGLRAQEGAPSTYRVIVEQMDVEDAAEPTAVRGLHVLPSSLDLAGAEIELVPAFSRENRLKQALDAVRDLYDVILIDCPPSLGLLTINALVAADQVLVPIQCEYYALEGLGQLMRTVKLVADSLNRGLGVGGVVLTMFDGRTNLSQQVVDEVRNYFGDIAYQTIVPRTVRLSEAPSYGQPIGVFDAASRGARAYQRLAREVARRLDLELEEEDVSPLDRLLGSTAPPSPDEAAPLPTDLGPGDVPVPPDSDVAAGPAAQETEPADQDHGHQGPEEHPDPGQHEHHGDHHDHGHQGYDEPAHGTEGQP